MNHNPLFEENPKLSLEVIPNPEPSLQENPTLNTRSEKTVFGTLWILGESHLEQCVLQYFLEVVDLVDILDVVTDISVVVSLCKIFSIRDEY